MRRASIIAGLLVSAAVYAAEFGRPMLFDGGFPATTPTSIIALLGSPDNWDGRAINVDGFLQSDLHGVMLFASSEYCQNWMEQYGVLVVLDTVEPEVTWSQLPTDECVPAHVQGVFIYTPADPPERNTITFRQRPGLIEARYVAHD